MSSKVDENLNLPTKILRSLCCPSCNLPFFIKDFTLRGCRCPLLLQCGHSMCDVCIQQNLKVSKSVTCELCSHVSHLESQEKSNYSFPPNMYLVGSLLVLQNVRLVKDKRLTFTMKNCKNFNYVVKEQSNSALNSDSKKTCEECSLAAVWYCEDCKSNFCEICWNRVHGSARCLMKHCKTAMSISETSNISIIKCPEHKTQYLEFFCKGCTTVICSDCAIQKHQGEGHSFITLKNKTLEINSVQNAAEEAKKVCKRMRQTLETAAEEAKKVCKRMRQTLEKVKMTEKSHETPEKLLLDLEAQIIRNFSRLHGILQFEEEELLKKLRENSNERRNGIQTLRLQLEDQIQTVERLLREFEFVQGGSEISDVIGLHARLKEVQKLPCYLISLNPRIGEVQVAFDESLIEFIRSYCKMDLPSNEVFELRSSFDLPEDYSIEPLQVLDEEEILKFEPGREPRVSDVETLSNFSLRDIDLDAKDLQLDTSSKPSAGTAIFQERKTYSVRVSYIRNPGEFYVTLNWQRSKQQAIDKRASQHAETSTDFPRTVAKDEIYLAKYTVDNKWYRARVKKVFPPKKIQDEERVKIYYLDYGNTETVTVSRLRSLPRDMVELPLAVKCKLFDCVPKQGEWCPESTKTMEKILSNYTATMFIMKVQRDCLEVDLSVIYPDGEIGRDIVSVRDALLFLEFSSFVHGFKIPRNGKTFKVLDQRLPSVGETFNVVITHVNSPSDFFVQNAEQDLSYLHKLTAEMQKYYSGNSEKGIIYNPTVGMPCAALFPLRQLWYRARIVDVPGKKMVTVFYIDYGNRSTIPWTSIRVLKESFLKLPPLALNCELTGIVPNGTVWCAEAKSYLEKYLPEKGCRVFVSEKLILKRRLGVFLYKQVGQEEVCVNTLFINECFAIELNSNCLWKSKFEEKKEEMFEDRVLRINRGEQSSEDDELNDPLEWKKSRSFQNRSGRKLKVKEMQKLHKSEKEDFSEMFSTDNIFQMKVKILSAESPFSIQVTFPSLTRQFEELQSKLNQFYQNSFPSAVELAEGRMCAVYDSAEKSWYRASIQCILPNGHVKVFLKDLAKVTTVQTSALRELDSSFNKYPSCSVKCHLADVEPVGKQWPSVSSEYLQNELQKYKEVYMTKCGQIENKSLPVKLWVQKVFPTGALEPTPKEWITLNRLLVKEGLAVPKKQKTSPPDDVECLDDVKYGDNEEAVHDLSVENSTKEEPTTSIAFLPLITEWPPPEPLTEYQFTGVPTYVDYRACIYIYNEERDGNKLESIRKTLFKEFQCTARNSELDDLLWSEGQPCMVRYHLDSCWYRGLILETNGDGTYNVLFVDYGNVEKCESQDLREAVKLHDIPVISHRFQLHGVAPLSEDGEWPIAVIDLLHSLVVDKKCKVFVLKPSLNPEEPSVITLQIIENEVDVGGFLVSEGLALSTSFSVETSCAPTFDNFSPKMPSSVSSNVELPSGLDLK